MPAALQSAPITIHRPAPAALSATHRPVAPEIPAAAFEIDERFRAVLAKTPQLQSDVMARLSPDHKALLAKHGIDEIRKMTEAMRSEIAEKSRYTTLRGFLTKHPDAKRQVKWDTSITAFFSAFPVLGGLPVVLSGEPVSQAFGLLVQGIGVLTMGTIVFKEGIQNRVWQYQKEVHQLENSLNTFTQILNTHDDVIAHPAEFLSVHPEAYAGYLRATLSGLDVRISDTNLRLEILYRDLDHATKEAEKTPESDTTEAVIHASSLTHLETIQQTIAATVTQLAELSSERDRFGGRLTNYESLLKKYEIRQSRFTEAERLKSENRIAQETFARYKDDLEWTRSELLTTAKTDERFEVELSQGMKTEIATRKVETALGIESTRRL